MCLCGCILGQSGSICGSHFKNHMEKEMAMESRLYYLRVPSTDGCSVAAKA